MFGLLLGFLIKKKKLGVGDVGGRGGGGGFEDCVCILYTLLTREKFGSLSPRKASCNSQATQP